MLQKRIELAQPGCPWRDDTAAFARWRPMCATSFVLSRKAHRDVTVSQYGQRRMEVSASQNAKAACSHEPHPVTAPADLTSRAASAATSPVSPAERLPRGFGTVVAAQFASALADNALLIVAIAWLIETGRPGWWAPLLKFAFTVSYVVLAPVVGPLADAFPKGRLMACMNGVKIVGLGLLAAGFNPLLAFAVIGFGAATYAPAKYGLVTEMARPEQLVAANAWLEVSVVCAALLGTVLGGLLVSPLAAQATLGLGCPQFLPAQVSPCGPLPLAIAVVLMLYAKASVLNFWVLDSGARYARRSIHPIALVRDFGGACVTLWRDPLGGLSLAVTTVFWGFGATLQFAVLRWAGESLGLSLDQAAYLQAAVAVGVVAGAAVAGRSFALSEAARALPLGILLGVLVPVVAVMPSLGWALPLLVLVGAVGGLLVVPMNALLQHRGFRLLTAGRSIAVQGFHENASVLLMLALYAGLLAAEVPVTWLMAGFGGSIAAGMALLWWRQSRRTCR
jgi:MFS transporter, LPLT family, lysophospholipid transporter